MLPGQTPSSLASPPAEGWTTGSGLMQRPARVRRRRGFVVPGELRPLMATDSKTSHWNATYASGDESKSWFQSHADVSERLIRSVSTDKSSVIDVGGGASTLVDDLLGAKYTELTVLDVSSQGMSIAQNRLGDQSRHVNWIVADISRWRPAKQYDAWHDRAVLHFMVNPQSRADYLRALRAATGPGSHAIIGVFGPEGPENCSGLPVERYDEDRLRALLTPWFVVEKSELHEHTTPSGGRQQFVWVVARRIAPDV